MELCYFVIDIWSEIAQINFIDMQSGDMDDFLKVLQEWKEQPGKSITSVLTRIDQAKNLNGKDIDDVLKGVTDFHKEITKADETLVDVKWYELCIRNKKKLKKMQETAEKQRKLQQPHLEKKSSNVSVVYPEELTAGRGSSDERILKYLFKSFVSNFEEAMTNPQIVSFLQSTLKEIKYKFDGKAFSTVDRADDSINKRVISICTRLSKQSSKESKEKMINGEITPKQLSSDDQELYFDEKTKENIRKIQREEVERNSGGYYDEMKKRINKDACEECRYCRKKKAYCEDQKQIRASDEPMTRFMRCNNCEKAWRD